MNYGLTTACETSSSTMRDEDYQSSYHSSVTNNSGTATAAVPNYRNGYFNGNQINYDQRRENLSGDEDDDEQEMREDRPKLLMWGLTK